MTEHPAGAARTLPLPVVALFMLAGVVGGISLLVALLHAVGVVGLVLVGGVIGAFAVVVLAVLRRRPISID